MAIDDDDVRDPASIDDVTATWLTSALRRSYVDATVTSCTATAVRHGSCTTARLVLEYDRAGSEAGLPATVYVKGDWTGRRSGLVVSEARFYRDVAPHLSGVNMPQGVLALVDEERNEGVVLMEDLAARHAAIAGPDDAFTEVQALDLAEQLARLHALWFDADDLRAREWLRRTGTVVDPGEQAYADETGIFGTFQEWWWDKRLANGHCDVLPDQLKDRLAIKRALANLYRLEAGAPTCLVHGDPHLGNMFVDPDGRPGLYDWGGYVGRWAHDLTYAIVGCLDVAERRRVEEAVLGRYLDALRAAGGPDIDWDAAWLSWRRQVIHGLLFMMCSPRQQPEALIAQQTIRFGAAAVDHDLLGLLDVD